MVKGGGRIKTTNPVTVQVAPEADTERQTFKFSREWKVPRLTFHHAAGRLALLNISLPIPDDDLACEYLLVGQPVIHHLGIESRKLV